MTEGSRPSPSSMRWSSALEIFGLGELGAALGDDLVERNQARVVVVGKAARLVMENAPDIGQPVEDRKRLVDLLLVLRDDQADARVVEHQGDLVGDRVGIDRHGNGAQHLRCGDRPIESRTVGAGDRDPVALAEAEPGKALRKRARFVVDLGPGPCAPDPEILVAKRRTPAANPGVHAHELGERVVGVGAFRRRTQKNPPVATAPPRSLIDRSCPGGEPIALGL